MFKGEPEAKEKAARIAQDLADHKRFKSHGRKITRVQAKEMGLKVEDLESDPETQDLILGVFFAVLHTFQGTTATKIIENHLGKAMMKIIPVPQGPQPEQPAESTPSKKRKKKK